jgi:hypothetical protein
MMPQPEHDLRECFEVSFIGMRYGRLEVVHDDRLAEGNVHVPARSDHASKVLNVWGGMRGPPYLCVTFSPL